MSPTRLSNTDDFVSPTRDALEASGTLRAAELHPSTQAFMRRVARYGGLTDRVSVKYARRRIQTMMPLVATRPAVASVVDRMISGPHGQVPLRIVTPRGGTEPRPAIVWFPGGGFVLGDLVTAEPTARSLANKLGVVVVCVDYRKAPEHSRDDGYDDAMAAVRWVSANAESIGVNARSIGVGGDSAGGNLATVVAQEYTAAGGAEPLALQLLVYPAVSTENEPARGRNATGGFLDLTAMRWFETHLAGATDPDSSRHCPLAAQDLSGLPPAVIITAGYDPLRDEGIVYLDRLRDAGVPAEHLHYADEVHGFFPMDLILDNADHAMNAAADLAAKFLQVDDSARVIPRRSSIDAARARLSRRLNNSRTLLNATTEWVVHNQIRLQRRAVRSLGLPTGRDVEALNTRIKRLEHETRTLRRELGRHDGAH